MTKYEIYVFILCLMVFIMLVSMFSVMLSIVFKQRLKLIRGGLEDEALKAEYSEQKKRNKKANVLGCLVAILISIVFIAFFAFSLYVNLSGDVYYENVPTIKVVNTSSMSQKHPQNSYLTKYGLDNQFQAFDLIFAYKKPKENDIKLYDIVVYESNGAQIIHRVVGIEEPNAEHPDERYFLCRGDAVEQNDYFPVYYSQIRAIYRDQRIPFVGSFVKFMQSPAGWLCAALIVFGLFGMPVLEKKLEKEQLARLRKIGYIKDGNNGGDDDASSPRRQEVRDELPV